MSYSYQRRHDNPSLLTLPPLNRVGFVGSQYGPESQSTTTLPDVQTAGDAVISHLDQLRQIEGWKDLFLPSDAGDDHPGRVQVKRDLVQKLGLR